MSRSSSYTRGPHKRVDKALEEAPKPSTEKDNLAPMKIPKKFWSRFKEVRDQARATIMKMPAKDATPLLEKLFDYCDFGQKNGLSLNYSLNRHCRF